MTSKATLQASPECVEEWIVERIGEMVNAQPSAISSAAKFESFGIDSAKAISLVMELEERLAAPGEPPPELPLELLFEADSIAEAAQNISAYIKAKPGDRSAFFGQGD